MCLGRFYFEKNQKNKKNKKFRVPKSMIFYIAAGLLYYYFVERKTTRKILSVDQ